MRKILLQCFAVLTLFVASCTTTQHARNNNSEETYRTEEQLSNSKLNNRRLEKNLDKFAEELNLSKRQLKQLKKIDRRYVRLERKLNRRDGKRRDKRRLAEEKRKEIIDVLTADQERQLEALSKKGRFSFDQLFGR
jgi:Spy/CpxP family protein refolding chaperone